MQINFLVSKRIESSNGFCELKDKKGQRMPIESHFWHKNEVYTGDSIVKMSNSTLVSIYRKKEWYDEAYYIAKQFNLE